MKPLLILLTLLCLTGPADYFISVAHLVGEEGHCTATSVMPGRWLTAGHCQLDHFADGNEALEVKQDLKADLRLVTGPIAPPFKVAKSEPEIGEEVVLIGWTDIYFELLAYEAPKPIVFFGHVQVIDAHLDYKDESGDNAVEGQRNFFGAGGGPGMSGGPILNRKGELVGMSDAFVRAPGFSMVSPTVKSIRKFLGLH
jgi:hypothetical protein